MEPSQNLPGLSSLLQLVGFTLRDPKSAATAIMRFDLPMPLLWQILAAVVCVSVFLGQASLLLVAEPGETSLPFVGSPLVLAVFQFLLIAAIVYLIHFIGRGMGGSGRLPDSLVLMTWLQVMMACLQVVQSVLMLFIPALAVFIGYLGLAMFLWLLTNFIAVLHGFRSLGMVFVMIVVSAFAVTFVLSIVMSILGIVPPGVVNV